MTTGAIITLVIVVILILALLAFVVARQRRNGGAKREAQAREQLQEARVRSARAESERAAADEQAARARRQRAEVEAQAAKDEKEAADRGARADRERLEAKRLQEKAHKLAPHLAKDDHAPRGDAAGRTDRTPARDADQDGVPDDREARVGDSHRGDRGSHAQDDARRHDGDADPNADVERGERRREPEPGAGLPPR